MYILDTFVAFDTTPRGDCSVSVDDDRLIGQSIVLNLSGTLSKRNLSTGLLAEWQRICKESADVLPLSNRVVVASCGSETLKKVEESMERLQIKVGPKIKGDSTEDEVKSVTTGKADTAVDDVISFNVGGTIIAVLRSTLLLMADSDSLLTAEDTVESSVPSLFIFDTIGICRPAIN